MLTKFSSFCFLTAFKYLATSDQAFKDKDKDKDSTYRDKDKDQAFKDKVKDKDKD